MSATANLGKMPAPDNTDFNLTSFLPINENTSEIDHDAVPYNERAKLINTGILDRTVSFRTGIAVHQNPADQARVKGKPPQNSPSQPDRQPKEALEILSILQDEVNKVKTAIENHVDPSTIYESLRDPTIELEAMTFLRPSDQPSYLKLVSLNFDHFGADAEKAYNAGHTAALQLAQEGDLLGAYKLNAFADHFLEDRFSSGHLRTPRNMLSGDIFRDLCAKFMHDEDSAIGLNVQNPRGDKWKAYGDKRLADHVDQRNRQLCQEAVQMSANEVYDCWKSGQIPSVYGVWQIAPTLESANGRQDCCPLFVSRPEEDGEWRRGDIDDRRDWAFTGDFWYWSTLLELEGSKRWKWPITLDP